MELKLGMRRISFLNHQNSYIKTGTDINMRARSRQHKFFQICICILNDVMRTTTIFIREILRALDVSRRETIF